MATKLIVTKKLSITKAGKIIYNYRIYVGCDSYTDGNLWNFCEGRSIEPYIPILELYFFVIIYEKVRVIHLDMYIFSSATSSVDGALHCCHLAKSATLCSALPCLSTFYFGKKLNLILAVTSKLQRQKNCCLFYERLHFLSSLFLFDGFYYID